jgi:hypothetical protein
MKRSYVHGSYWIEIETRAVDNGFEGRAYIFVSRDFARSGGGPIRVVSPHRATGDEAMKAAATSAEAWADGPGAGAGQERP